ncbi:MAG: hypothetical protein R2849_08665 [Thermomicrobiales bacterium]
MSEGVRADDRLVWLDRDPVIRPDEPAGRDDLGRVDVGVDTP